MYLIKNEDIKLLSPSEFDYKLAEEKGLAQNGVFNNYYLMLMSKYYYYLEKYIDRECKISEIEKVFIDNSEDFNKVLDEDKDVYQSLSNNSFFYIRNTLYVERLKIDEIKAILSSKSLELTPDIETIIKNTFKSIITTHFKNTNENEKYDIDYGYNNDKESFSPNNSLVLGLRFAPPKKYDDELVERNNFTNNIIKFINPKLSEIMGVDVRVIEYSTSMIKKHM